MNQPKEPTRSKSKSHKHINQTPKASHKNPQDEESNLHRSLMHEPEEQLIDSCVDDSLENSQGPNGQVFVSFHRNVTLESQPGDKKSGQVITMSNLPNGSRGDVKSNELVQTPRAKKKGSSKKLNRASLEKGMLGEDLNKKYTIRVSKVISEESVQSETVREEDLISENEFEDLKGDTDAKRVTFGFTGGGPQNSNVFKNTLQKTPGKKAKSRSRDREPGGSQKILDKMIRRMDEAKLTQSKDQQAKKIKRENLNKISLYRKETSEWKVSNPFTADKGISNANAGGIKSVTSKGRKMRQMRKYPVTGPSSINKKSRSNSSMMPNKRSNQDDRPSRKTQRSFSTHVIRKKEGGNSAKKKFHFSGQSMKKKKFSLNMKGDIQPKTFEPIKKQKKKHKMVKKKKKVTKPQKMENSLFESVEVNSLGTTNLDKGSVSQEDDFDPKKGKNEKKRELYNLKKNASKSGYLGERKLNYMRKIEKFKGVSFHGQNDPKGQNMKMLPTPDDPLDVDKFPSLMERTEPPPKIDTLPNIKKAEQLLSNENFSRTSLLQILQDQDVNNPSSKQELAIQNNSLIEIIHTLIGKEKKEMDSIKEDLKNVLENQKNLSNGNSLYNDSLNASFSQLKKNYERERKTRQNIEEDFINILNSKSDHEFMLKERKLLQSKLKDKKDELFQAKFEIKRLKKVIVELTNENEGLKEKTSGTSFPQEFDEFRFKNIPRVRSNLKFLKGKTLAANLYLTQSPHRGRKLKKQASLGDTENGFGSKPQRYKSFDKYQHQRQDKNLIYDDFPSSSNRRYKSVNNRNSLHRPKTNRRKMKKKYSRLFGQKFDNFATIDMQKEEKKMLNRALEQQSKVSKKLVARLENENARLKKVNRKLEEDKKELMGKNQRLKAEVDDLTRRNKNLGFRLKFFEKNKKFKRKKKVKKPKEAPKPVEVDEYFKKKMYKKSDFFEKRSGQNRPNLHNLPPKAQRQQATVYYYNTNQKPRNKSQIRPGKMTRVSIARTNKSLEKMFPLVDPHKFHSQKTRPENYSRTIYQKQESSIKLIPHFSESEDDLQGSRDLDIKEYSEDSSGFDVLGRPHFKNPLQQKRGPTNLNDSLDIAIPEYAKRESNAKSLFYRPSKNIKNNSLFQKGDELYREHLFKKIKMNQFSSGSEEVDSKRGDFDSIQRQVYYTGK